MTTAARFVVVSALSCWRGGPLSPAAYRPAARTRHFAELVKEYVRLGLPLPPPDAPLVRIRRELRNGDDDSTEIRYLLGFPRTPVASGRDPHYLVGSGRIWTLWIPPHTVEPVDPTPDCLGLPSQMDGHEFLFFAIQCHWRGWHEFADVALCQGAGTDLSGLSRRGPATPNIHRHPSRSLVRIVRGAIQSARW